MKSRILIITLLLMILPSTIFGKDLGMNGVPTPALAMYAAQPNFAVDQCVSDGLTKDVKGAANFLRNFNNGVGLTFYKENDEEFTTNYDLFIANYTASWGNSSSEKRQQFCDSLNSEIALKNEKFSLLKTPRWIGSILYFRSKFSPISKESIERLKKRQKMAAILSVIGGVATTAASVSASHDAVTSAKAGNWNLSNQQMNMSRRFSQSTEAITWNQSTFEKISDKTISVLDVKTTDGSLKIARCPVVEHFSVFSAPAESPTWITYQKVWVPCRDPVPSDFQSID